MATNGKSVTLGIVLPLKTVAALEAKAKSLGLTKSKYAKIILQNWVDEGKKLSLTEG